MPKSSKSMRLFLFNGALFCLLGIWLSGWDQVHWVSYVLPGAFLLAAATGFCPGLLFSRWVTGELKSEQRGCVGDC